MLAKNKKQVKNKFHVSHIHISVHTNAHTASKSTSDLGELGKATPFVLYPSGTGDGGSGGSYLHSVVPVTPEKGDWRRTPQLCTSSCICIEDRAKASIRQSSCHRCSFQSKQEVSTQERLALCKARPPSPAYMVPSPESPTMGTHATCPAWCRAAHTPTSYKPPLAFLHKSRMPVCLQGGQMDLKAL